ncbi:hypothetical protein CBR_g39552 [Chara braunii]|uniref:RCC1-like domain-containing protein n=1 Tax=Chara braunii TaxID=69332 RepID=A0A388LRX3_CHABU|nr:hypothetical protein CBR_g39552 [Chara braunii]|eukprot:GBG85090.1 hypothetical protein CBR_g39552 [Chara braunii]
MATAEEVVACVRREGDVYIPAGRGGSGAGGGGGGDGPVSYSLGTEKRVTEGEEEEEEGTACSRLERSEVEEQGHHSTNDEGDSSSGGAMSFLVNAPTELLLRLLTYYGLTATDLARLEVTCSFFRQQAKLPPNRFLSIAEVAAHDWCNRHVLFLRCPKKEKLALETRCGGTWKLVMRYILALDRCLDRGRGHVAAGARFSVCVSESGHVYSFGRGNYGELGRWKNNCEWKPRLVTARALRGTRIVRAAAGLSHTIVVSDAGHVFTWGLNAHGCCGHGPLGRALTPARVEEGFGGSRIVHVGAGRHFSVALASDGGVFTFGLGQFGRLGHGREDDEATPRRVEGINNGLKAIQVAVGSDHSLVIAVDEKNCRRVLSFGEGEEGQLGHGREANELVPKEIRYFTKWNVQVMAVAAGSVHSVAVAFGGQVYTWGNGFSGCLGHEDTRHRLVPHVVDGVSHVCAVNVAAGQDSTFVVGADGDVYSFGSTYGGRLGHPDVLFTRDSSVRLPRRVNILKNECVVEVAAGAYFSEDEYDDSHTLAVTESGKVFGFGACFAGQLGLGKRGTDHAFEPEEITGLRLRDVSSRSLVNRRKTSASAQQQLQSSYPATLERPTGSSCFIDILCVISARRLNEQKHMATLRELTDHRMRQEETRVQLYSLEFVVHTSRSWMFQRQQELRPKDMGKSRERSWICQSQPERQAEDRDEEGEGGTKEKREMTDLYACAAVGTH